MSGESNNIKYSVDPQQLDLGSTLYNKPVERDLVISNNGKVPSDFAINTSRLSRASIVEPTPRSGVVGPGQKETVKLKVGICRGVWTSAAKGHVRSHCSRFHFSHPPVSSDLPWGARHPPPQQFRGADKRRLVL